MFNGKSGLLAGANLGRRNLEGPAGQNLNAKWRRQRSRYFARPRDDYELNQACELFGIAPLWKCRDMVSADEVKQFTVGETRFVITHGIDSERDAAPMDFLIVDFVIGFADEGEAEHAQANFGWCGLTRGLEGRLRRENEEQPVQLKFFTRGLRHEQMPKMNWIE